MANHNSPNVIPGDGEYEDDRPHDERLYLSTVVEDGRSFASLSTYAKKDSAIHGSSAAPKRSAQKAPSTETNPECSLLPPSSASSLPPLGDPRQRNNWSSRCGSELYLGFPKDDELRSASLWQNSNHQHRLPISQPLPFLDTMGSGGRSQNGTSLGSRAHSASMSGKYEDALESETVDSPGSDNISRCLEEITLDSQFRTTISSLKSPSDSGSYHGGSRAFDSVSSRSGNPRSILNERYQKKYNRSLNNRDFVSLKDSRDGDHIPLFTSTFVCPESGEPFKSGDLLEGKFVVRRDDMNWYKKKASAEFAAAGRAEDCFRFRSAESGRRGLVGQFCAEPPYLKRSREEEQEELLVFLGWRACDTDQGS